MRSSKRIVRNGLAIVALVLAGTEVPSIVAGTDSKAASNAKKKPEAAKQAPAPPTEVPGVITNETLLRLFGPPEPSSAPETSAEQEAPKEAPADPLKLMEEEKQKAAEHQAKLAEAEKRVADAQADVQNLEKRLLEQRNPLLPRPQISKEEAAAEKELNGTQRVDRTQQQIEEARKKLEQARADLEKTRSGS